MKATNQQTAENIKRIEAFTKYLKSNFKTHYSNIKHMDNLCDLENSFAFLRDYNEVSEQLIKVIEAYNEKTGSEF